MLSPEGVRDMLINDLLFISTLKTSGRVDAAVNSKGTFMHMRNRAAPLKIHFIRKVISYRYSAIAGPNHSIVL